MSTGLNLSKLVKVQSSVTHCSEDDHYFCLFTDAVDESEYGLRDALFTACKVGDVDALHTLLQLGGTVENQEQPESNPSDVFNPLTLLNKPIDSSGFTLLHVATAAAQKAVVRLLLDAGANPACRYKEHYGLVAVVVKAVKPFPDLISVIFCCRDNKGQTPYIVASDKDTRNVFRKYMGENPDKYDYSKTQVRVGCCIVLRESSEGDY